MKPQHNKTILLYTAISLVALFLILWFTNFSNLGIREMFAGVQLRIYGILILIAFVIILFLLQRQLFKDDPDISLFALIAASAIVSFTSLLIYQFVRQVFILGNGLSEKLTDILVSSAFPAFILTLVASSTALRLKKYNGIWSRIPLLLLIIIVIFSKQYIKQFEW